MNRIWHIPFGVNFIEILCERFIPFREDRDYSDLRIVFPTKRAGLYLRKILANRHKDAFIPPDIQTMDELILNFFFEKNQDSSLMSELEEYFTLYEIIQESNEEVEDKDLKKGFSKKSFFDIAQWIEKIAGFISTSEVELVEDKRLVDLKLHTEIGLNLPEYFNKLLGYMKELRRKFREIQEEKRSFTRGYIYAKVAELCSEGFLPDKHTIFAGIFGLTTSEKKILFNMLKKDLCDIVWNCNPDEWDIVKKTLKEFNAESQPVCDFKKYEQELFLHPCLNTMQEVEQLGEILEKESPEDIVVVLPDAQNLMPVLTFGVPESFNDNFNVSLDYPLKTTSVLSLINLIAKLQMYAKVKDKKILYDIKNYISFLEHPFIKNLKLAEDKYFREVSEKIKEVIERNIKGRMFFSLEEIESSLKEEDQKNILEIHKVFFYEPFMSKSLSRLADSIIKILNFIITKTEIRSYILSSEIFVQLFKELEFFKRDSFFFNEIVSEESYFYMWNWFMRRLSSISIHFDTKPLQRLEILGMLETRALNFKEVIILDVEEGILPSSRQIDPLVPQDIFQFIGLPSIEDKEEMYRYYFFRLIRTAERLWLFYKESPDRKRSRYIEEIVWEKEKEKNKIDVIKPVRKINKIHLDTESYSTKELVKTTQIIDALKNKLWHVTDFDCFLYCGIKFYYSKILNLDVMKEYDKEIEELDRGTIVHEILQEIFRNYINKALDEREILKLMKDKVEKYFSKYSKSGEFILLKKLVLIKLESFLSDHLKKTPSFKVIECEKEFEGKFEGLKIKGRIDRIDSIDDNKIRIVDYKTGSIDNFKYDKELALKDNPSVEDISKKIGTFQGLLYYILFKQHDKEDRDVDVVFVSIKEKKIKNLFEKNKSKEEVLGYYKRLFKIVVKDLFDKDKPFRRYPETTKCSICEYFNICNYCDRITEEDNF